MKGEKSRSEKPNLHPLFESSFYWSDPNIAGYYAVAGSIFQNITPFSLPPGTYSIVATGYNYLPGVGGIKDLNTTTPLIPPMFDTLLGALTLSGDACVNGTGFGVPSLAFPPATPNRNRAPISWPEHSSPPAACRMPARRCRCSAWKPCAAN
jgi:hypothetical protein